MANIVAFAALGSPILQSLLMGVIGYPLARRTPGGMDAFRRSGFTWWLITLLVVIVAALIRAPEYLEWTAPSVHHLTVTRVGVTMVAAIAALGAIELGAAWIDRRFPSAKAQAGHERYNSALPKWAGTMGSETALLSLTAFLEEAVYRGVALSGLVLSLGLEKAAGAGIVAVAFGVAHWYYGTRQVLLKMAMGSVFCAVALSSGWVVAACVHVLFNVGLVVIESSRR